MLEGVFISHSRSDERFARQLATALRREGFGAWLDMDELTSARHTGRAIGEAIAAASRAVVVVGGDEPTDWTRHEWSLILDAYWRGKMTRLVPVLLGPASPPGFLQELQAVRAAPDPDCWEDAFAQIAEALRRPDEDLAAPTIEAPLAEELTSRWALLAGEAKSLEPSEETLGAWRTALVRALQEEAKDGVTTSEGYADLLWHLASIDMRLDRHTEALATLEQALEIHEERKDATPPATLATLLFALGRIHLRTDDVDAAIAALRRSMAAAQAADSRPLQLECAYNLALAYHRAGDDASAWRMGQRAFALAELVAGPGSENARHYREALRGAW